MAIVEMRRLTLLFPSDCLDVVEKELTDLGCVEISDAASLSPGLATLNDPTSVAEVEAELGQVESAIRTLEPYAGKKSRFTAHRPLVDRHKFRSCGGIDSARETVTELNQTVSHIDSLKNQTQEVEAAIRTYTPWRTLGLPAEITEYRSTAVITGTIPERVSLDRLTGEADCFAADELTCEHGTRYVVLLTHTSDRARTLELAGQHGFSAVDLSAKYGRPHEILARLDKYQNELRVSLADAEQTLRGLARRLGELKILADELSTKLTLAKARQALISSGHCTVLSAWIPQSSETQVTTALERLLGQDCAYDLAPPAPGDDVPVLLENNRFGKNFEWVMGMYSYPRYGSYDPSFVMGIFYCLIFGMMFADVGYGLVLMLVCFLGAKFLTDRESTRRFLLMFGWCGVGSSLMGVLFGGYLGDLPLRLMGSGAPVTLALLLDPLLDPMGFLILSLVMGAMHLICGMALRMMIVWRSGRPFDALLDTIFWWLLFAGLGIMIISREVGIVLASASAILLVLTQGRARKTLPGRLFGGLFSLYNLVGMASDLVSYSRIMALGLASAVVAQVVNILATMMLGSAVGTLFATVVLILGHALNMAINILGAFVHTGRLQYIEFFGRFFTEGGRTFNPLTHAEKYTRDSTILQGLRPRTPAQGTF